ncbi:MAG: hypothetical protein JW808_10365 [Victivallales bacterium]|nr:hypothetical protein [Victivallales bacterium]
MTAGKLIPGMDSGLYNRVLTMKMHFLSLASLTVLLSPSLFGADDPALSRRFYAGDILRAEVRPEDYSDPVVIKNVSPYKPASRITTEVGYALLTVRLDAGRSLGIYDYSLFDGRAVFPCVALMDDNGEFDASLWEIKDTKPDKMYSMLFKVQIPVMGIPKYSLRFNLLQGKWQDVNLPFVNVKDMPFTAVKDIPQAGMLGVDPYKPKPGAEAPLVSKDDADPDAAPTAAVPDQPEIKPELGDAELKKPADQAVLEGMLKDGKKDEAEKKDGEKPKKDVWEDLDKL